MNTLLRSYSNRVHRLHVEKGPSNMPTESLWAANLTFKEFNAESAVSMSLSDDGALRVSKSGGDKKNDETILSKSRCVAESKAGDEKTDAASAAHVYLTLNAATGAPEVVCSRSQVIALEF